jgi:hypothetical protein
MMMKMSVTFFQPDEADHCLLATAGSHVGVVTGYHEVTLEGFIVCSGFDTLL